jgi:hypothetical protein
MIGAAAVVVAVCTVGLTGCSIVNKVKTAEHDVAGNKATIDTFTNKIQSSTTATFEATYETTGASPATIVYAVQPPQGLAFTETPSSSSGPTADIIVNSTGEYSCSPPSSASSTWTCQKLGSATATVENQIFDLYTPSHWVGFLKGFSVAAGIAGDTVTTSTMTVNGFAMQCVNFRAPGGPGLSTICTTDQGILGYVKVASDSTNFEIKSYSPSPSALLFQLPPGAKITTSTPGTAAN